MEPLVDKPLATLHANTLANLCATNPMYEDFFANFGLRIAQEEKSFAAFVDTLSDAFWEENALSATEFTQLFSDFSEGIQQSVAAQQIRSLQIVPGLDKSSKQEATGFSIRPGEVSCIVGPTGSGKSRLLADIEWLANADTPTQRIVLINGQPVSDELQQAYGGKLIGQVTQNMNFVLDMDVYSFLLLHAQSRYLDKPEEKVAEVIALANELSGEGFNPKTPVTFLSGGQSRALMIADVACIGQAPIVLIDEIENAGVNKQKALDLLVKQDKIVLMASHDPLLILKAEKRIVIQNGGIHQVIKTSKAEKEYLKELEAMDAKMQEAREFFRHGKTMQ